MELKLVKEYMKTKIIILHLNMYNKIEIIFKNKNTKKQIICQ